MDKQGVLLAVATVVVLGVGGCFAFGPTSGGRANPAAFSSSLSNAKQATLGLIMYAADYDDVLPPAMGNEPALHALVDPYIKDPSVWRSYSPAGADFLSNPGLAFVKIPYVIAPATEVSFYESHDWSDGRVIVGYLDGHVRGERYFSSADLHVDMDLKGEEWVRKAKAALASPAGTPGP
jgi:prepilin-type processing-associated H-X9-DG protein